MTHLSRCPAVYQAACKGHIWPTAVGCTVAIHTQVHVWHGVCPAACSTQQQDHFSRQVLHVFECETSSGVHVWHGVRPTACMTHRQLVGVRVQAPSAASVAARAGQRWETSNSKQYGKKGVRAASYACL
jgi:hypothetical protein